MSFKEVAEYILPTSGRRLQIYAIEHNRKSDIKLKLHRISALIGDTKINDFWFPHFTDVPETYSFRFVPYISRTSMDADKAFNHIVADGLLPLPFSHFLDVFGYEASWNFDVCAFVCISNQILNNPDCPGLSLIPVMQQFPKTTVSKAQYVRLEEGFVRTIDLCRFGQVWPAGTMFPAMQVLL